MVFMPGGRAVNPITKTSWEGRGVTPDIAATHEDALRVALQRLGRSAASADISSLSQAQVFAPRTTPGPGSEAAARRLVEEASMQQFRYELMAPQLAATIRNYLPTLKAQFERWGAVQSVAFREVDPGGVDVYDVKFASGDARLFLVLAADGKALMADLR
jgi:hypothetical protein